MWKKKKQKMQLAFNAEKVFLAAGQPLERVFNYFQTSHEGLDGAEVERRQSLYGRNEVEHERREHPLTMFIRAFINPFIGVLTGLIVISYFLDVYLAEPQEQDWTATVIISTMVVLSAILRFWQEWKAGVSSAEVRGKKYRKGSVVELDNICYMGSSVVSGAATGIVLATGCNTYLGTIAKSIAGHRAATAFDRGIAKRCPLRVR